ncbi:hypothetical protein JCM8547_002528 [Rhodosporidiobolus lusitaniae]
MAASTQAAAGSSSSSNTSRLTWTTALVLLEASTHAQLSPSLDPFLSNNLTALQNPHNPFPASAASKTALQSGKLELVPKSGKTVDVDEVHQTAALAVADRFSVDEVLAYRALRVARKDSTGKGKGKDKDEGKVSEDEWDRVTAWLFEERMAVIGVVGLLLRTHDDPSHPVHELATKFLPSILTDTFAPSLLTAFVSRTSQPLPDTVRSSPTHSPFWTKQLVREQKALLELVFLTFYSPHPAEGSNLAAVLSAISATEFGARQENFGYFDAETQQTVREIGELLTLVAVEAMNLENAMDAEYPIGAPGEQGVEKKSIFHPENLVKVNEAVEAVVRVDSERSSPILLGWAFLLSIVTQSLLERGVPDAYHAWAEKSLRVEGSSSASPQPLFQLYAAHALSPSSSLFPILLSTLQSPLLGAPSLTSSASTSTADPNAVGYLSVLRGLLTSLPLLVRLSYLSPPQLEGLTAVFSALYGNPSAALLGAQFWEDQAVVAALEAAAAAGDSDDDDALLEVNRTARSAGETEIVELARARFPVQFGSLVQLVRALCSGVAGLLPPEHADAVSNTTAGTDDELLAQKCAQSTLAYLATLPSFTVILPPSSTSSPAGGVEASQYPDASTGYSFRTTRAVAVAPSVVLPAGTKGRLVSQQGRKPVVVAWDAEWSAWRLFRDVLEEFAGLGVAGKKAGAGGGRDVFGAKGEEGEGEALPIEWDSEEEKERDVTAVLDILRITLRNDPSLGPALVEHLSSPPPAATNKPVQPRPDLIEVLFRILERALAAPAVTGRGSASPAAQQQSTALVSSLLGLIAALLPSFPGVVWTFLRGSSLLFPSSSSRSSSSRSSALSSSSSTASVLSTERLTGQYSVTLSLLSLTHALILEEQVASCTTSAEYRAMKHGVLARALNWVRDEVWPVFGSWRFASLAEKYEVARRCVGVFRLVLEEAELFPSSCSSSTTPTLAPPAQVILSALLLPPTSSIAQLSPLLSPLAQGPDTILLLRKAGRYADAQALEDLVDSSLGLVVQLVRFRRRRTPGSSSLLEKLCLSLNGAAAFSSSAVPALPLLSTLMNGTSSTGLPSFTSRRPELLESLSRFILTPALETRLAVSAAKAVTLLVLASEGEPGKTGTASLSSLLGGGDGAERTLAGLLSVVEDPLAVGELQIAVWDLISAIVDSQPGLALLVVTGRHYPFSSFSDLVPTSDDKGKSKETHSSQSLSQSLAPPVLKSLPRTALGVALETVGIWSEAWKDRPSLLAAVLRFFDFTWQHLDDYGVALDEFRAKPAAWEAFVKIAFESPGAEPEDEEGTALYCYRVVAKAHAVRILALDIQTALRKSKPEDATSVKAFLAALRDTKQLTSALTSALSTLCAPELHHGIHALVRSTFPELDLDALRQPASTHPLDEAREFGSGYLYSLPLVRRKLDGFHTEQQHDSMLVGQESFDDVVEQTARLDLNFSLLEAQILDTRSWRQVLEIVLPLAKKSQMVSAAVLGVVGVVAKEVAAEDRVGQVMTTVQAERLSILLALVQTVQSVPADQGKAALVDLVCDLSAIFSSEALEPLESVARRATPAFHSTLFRITFFAFRQLNSYLPTVGAAAAPSAVTAEQRVKVTAATESILRTMLTATRDLLILARASKDLELEQDLALSVAVVSTLLKSPFAPSVAVWLAHVQALDLFRAAFEVIVYMDQLEPGRPLYAQHALDLCLAFATSSPRAAEQLALDGVMTALTNNALTAAAEVGAIPLVSPHDGSRTPQHQLWTSILALVVALVDALGESTRFVEQDVTGFVRLYGAQIVLALSWTADSPVSAAGLEELAVTVALMHGVARSSRSGAVVANAGSLASSPVVAVASVFVEQGLHLLQHVVYALIHPNHLAALVEGLTPEERGWLEKEAGEAELEKRPVASSVAFKMLHLARDVVSGLMEFSDAWRTLLKDPTDWRDDRAVVLPTATVTATEKASLGTLFDLCSYTIDTLRSTSSSTTSPPALPSSSPFPTLPPPSPAALRAACAETLETSLLLCATQLALHAKAAGQGAGQAGGRTLQELGSEVVDLVDKASGTSVVAAVGGKADPKDERNRKALLEVIKGKLGVWV